MNTERLWTLVNDKAFEKYGSTFQKQNNTSTISSAMTIPKKTRKITITITIIFIINDTQIIIIKTLLMIIIIIIIKTLPMRRVSREIIRIRWILSIDK